MPSLVATHNVSMWRQVGILKSGIYRLKVSREDFVVIKLPFVVRFPPQIKTSLRLVVLCSPLLVNGASPHNLK
jgi:hypothetical protein